MERNSLGRIVACGPALQSARVLLARAQLSGRRRDRRRWRSLVHRKLRPSRQPRGRFRPWRRRRAADRDPQYAGLPVASRPEPRRRFLAQPLRRAHASGRVRAARGRFSRGDDADHPARVLDRARAGHQRRLPGADADRRHQGARHPEALGAAALLRASGPARRRRRSGRDLHSRVGGRYHGITAAIETAQGLVIVSKGSGRVLLQQTEAHT